MRNTGAGEGMGTFDGTDGSTTADGRALFAAVRSVLTRIDAHAARAQGRPGRGQNAAADGAGGPAGTDAPGAGDHRAAAAGGADEPGRQGGDPGAAPIPRSELAAGDSTPTAAAAWRTGSPGPSRSRPRGARARHARLARRLLRAQPLRARCRPAGRRRGARPHDRWTVCSRERRPRARPPHLLARPCRARRCPLERADPCRPAAPLAARRAGRRDPADHLPAAAGRAHPALPRRLALSGLPVARTAAPCARTGVPARLVRSGRESGRRGLGGSRSACAAAGRAGRRGSADPCRHRRCGGPPFGAGALCHGRRRHAHRSGRARPPGAAVAARGDHAACRPARRGRRARP